METTTRPEMTTKVKAYAEMLKEYNDLVSELNTSFGTYAGSGIYGYETEEQRVATFNKATALIEKRIADAERLESIVKFLSNSPETAKAYNQYMNDLYNFRK